VCISDTSQSYEHEGLICIVTLLRPKKERDALLIRTVAGDSELERESRDGAQVGNKISKVRLRVYYSCKITTELTIQNCYQPAPGARSEIPASFRLV